jgi:hypothetical protein
LLVLSLLQSEGNGGRFQNVQRESSTSAHIPYFESF